MINEIMQKVTKHYNYVCEKCGEEHILAVAAYGSMNYGTFITGTSDVDTKAIYISSLDEALFQKPVSRELHIDDEHCEIKDIREMFNMYKKQNINFVETLFAQYIIINPVYAEYWQALIDIREDIAHYSMQYTVDSLVGQLLNTIHQAQKLDKSTKELQKKASNCLRLKVFLNKYTHGYSYRDCIFPDELNRASILDIKTGRLPFDLFTLDFFIIFCYNKL